VTLEGPVMAEFIRDIDLLEEWRENEASILACENTTTVDEFQQARSYYYQRILLEDRISREYNLDRTKRLDINAVTGCIQYVPEYDVTMEEA